MNVRQTFLSAIKMLWQARMPCPTMRHPRFTIRELFFATTFTALAVGLFMSAWRVNSVRIQAGGEVGPPMFPMATFFIGFAVLAAAWGVVKKRSGHSLSTASWTDDYLPGLAGSAPPLGMRLCWGLMVAGGL